MSEGVSDYRTVSYGAVEVAWTPELDGGGRGFGQDFVPLVRHLFGRVGRVFELCAGPGYIGFSLLASGLCDSLALADVNPRAVAAARETVRRNGLEGRVDVYECDGLEGLPDHERWSLVVGNPPHFARPPRDRPSRLTDDLDWALHRRFYRAVPAFLDAGGSVLLQENSEGSRPEEFLPMLADGGLDPVRTLWFTGGAAGPSFYHLWSMPRLPGLRPAPEPPTPRRVVPLRPAPLTPHPVPAAGPVDVVLVNEAGRPVRPRLVDGAGRDHLWLPLAVVPAGGSAPLPRLALRPGSHFVRDADRGLDLAHLLAGG